MSSESQQTESPPEKSGERSVSLEKEVASLLGAMSHPVILTGLILLGLLLDLVGELVRIGTTSTTGYSAFQVLVAIGTFIIVAVLFVVGLTKRSESDHLRFGMLLAAAIIFFSLPFII